MFCGNNNGCLWIIIILILLCGCGCGGCGNGCGCGNNNGCGCGCGLILRDPFGGLFFYFRSRAARSSILGRRIMRLRRFGSRSSR